MRSTLVALLTFLFSFGVFAQDAESILAESHILGYAPNLEIRAELRIMGRGAVQRRTVQVFLQRADDGASRMLAQIIEPPFLQSMKFLQHQDADGGQDRWLGSSRGVQRLSVGNYGQSLFNSDFTTDDFAYVDVGVLQLELLDREGDLVSIRATDESGGTRIVTVDEPRNLIVGVDYLDDSGNTKRRYTVNQVGSNGGVWHPVSAEMRDLVAGTYTELTTISLESPESIPARVFSRGSL
jgi:hypothetical protein